MLLPRQATLTLSASRADDDGIAVDQHSTGADLTITGALATASKASSDVMRLVNITATSNESTITFGVFGTDYDGTSVTESITGPTGGTAPTYSTKYFLTVSRIAPSASVAATGTASIDVGFADRAAMPWQRVNKNTREPWHMTFQTRIPTNPTGIGYTLQFTIQNVPEGPAPGSSTGLGQNTPITYNHPSVAAVTQAFSGSVTGPMRAMRLIATAHASAASLELNTLHTWE